MMFLIYCVKLLALQLQHISFSHSIHLATLFIYLFKSISLLVPQHTAIATFPKFCYFYTENRHATLISKNKESKRNSASQ